MRGMKGNKFKLYTDRIFFLMVLLGLGLPVKAQVTSRKQVQPTLTRIEFLFDASQSMYGRWQSGAKIDVAKNLMNQLLDSLRFVPNIELALRVYGH